MSFLITAVKNQCTDYLRKQSVRKNHVMRQSLSSVADSPETVYTISELEKMFREALDLLPENVRRAFEMSRFQHKTYKQIAEEMSISPKTVEAYIGKTLKLLREELKDFLPLALLTCGTIVARGC